MTASLWLSLHSHSTCHFPECITLRLVWVPRSTAAQQWQLSVTPLGAMATTSQLGVVRNETRPPCQERAEPHGRLGSPFVFDVSHKDLGVNIPWSHQRPLRFASLLLSSPLPRTSFRDHNLKKFSTYIAEQTQLQLGADFLCEFDAIKKFAWFDLIGP